MAAKVSVGDLLNPMERIAKALESTNKKIDDISVIVGGNSIDTITILASIDETLKDLTSFLKQNVVKEKIKKIATPNKENNVGEKGGGGDQSKLKNAIEIFKGLGVGIKDMGQGLLFFLIIPEKTGEKVKNIVVNIFQGLNEIQNPEVVGKIADSLIGLGKSLAIFGYLLVLAVPSMILGMAVLPLVKLFLMEMTWVMQSIKSQEDAGKGENNQFGFMTNLIDMGWGLSLFGFLLVLSIPSLVLGMAVLPLLKLFLMEMTWVMKSIESNDNANNPNNQFGFMSSLLDMGWGLVLFGFLLVLAIPSMIIGMALMPILKLFMMELGWVMKSLTNKETEKGMDAFIKLPKTIAWFAIMLVLVTPLLTVGTISALLLWGVSKLVSKSLNIFGKKKTQKGVKSMLLTSLAILAFGLSLMAFTLLIKPLIEEPKNLVALFGVIGGVALLFYVIGKVGKSDIAMGAIAMMVIGLSLMIFSLGFKMLLNESKPLMQNPELGLVILGVIGGLGLTFGILGTQLEFILMGAVAVGAIGASLLVLTAPLLVIAAAIEKMSKIESPEDAFANVMTSLIGGIKVMMDNFKYVNPITLALITPSILMLTGIVASLGVMASVMSMVASLKMPDEFDSKGKPTHFVQMKADDFMNAALNCALILKVFTSLFEPGSHTFESSDGTVTFEGIDTSIFDKISLNVKWGIKRLQSIVSSVAKMAKTLTDIASLRYATEFDANGNPTKYESMTGDDFMKASMNAAALLSFWVNMFGDSDQTITLGDGSTFTVSPLSLSALENVKRSTKRKIGYLGDIVGSVAPMADAIKAYARLMIPKVDEHGKLLEGQYDVMTDEDFNMAASRIQQILTLVMTTVTDETFVQKLDNLSKRATEKLSNVMTSINGVTSVIDVIEKIASGRFPKTYTQDENGNLKVTEYQSYDDMINSAGGEQAIAERLQRLISLPIKAVADLNDDILDDANDKIEDFTNFFKDFNSSINTVIKMVTDLYKIKNENGEGFENIFSVVINGAIEPIKQQGDEGMNKMLLFGTTLGKFSEGLVKFNKPAKEFTQIDFASAETNFTKMWTTFDGVLNGVLKKQKESPVLKQIDKLMGRLIYFNNKNIWKKTAEGIKKIADAIKSVDTNVIRAYADLFEAAGKLPQSEAGYAKLAAAVQHIEELFQKHNDTTPQVTIETAAIETGVKNGVKSALNGGDFRISRVDVTTATYGEFKPKEGH